MGDDPAIEGLFDPEVVRKIPAVKEIIREIFPRVLQLYLSLYAGDLREGPRIRINCLFASEIESAARGYELFQEKLRELFPGGEWSVFDLCYDVSQEDIESRSPEG